jgi:hypothetical protein
MIKEIVKNDGVGKVANMQAKRGVINLCVIFFVLVMTKVALIAFFVSLSKGLSDSAYSIASTYILCMLLAAPTLKVFLDTVDSIAFKRLNVALLMLIFTVILLIAVVLFLGKAGMIG